MSELPNYKDYTVKIAIKDDDEIIMKLNQLGASFVGIDHQVDTYFRTEDGKLKLRKGIIENFITHYRRDCVDGAERTTVFRYDVNPSLANIATLFAGNVVIGTVEKQRRIYYLNTIKLHLDTLKNGRHFLELEAIDRDGEFTDAELRDRCFNTLSMLEIDLSRVEKTGYLSV